MIVIRVELWSARDGARTELARMRIANDGQRALLGDGRSTYRGETFTGRSAATLDRGQVNRSGVVRSWPSESVHVWNLVAAMLAAMGYGKHAASAGGKI